MPQLPDITLSPIGLLSHTAYLTGESIGWGPEQPHSVFRYYPLQHDHSTGLLRISSHHLRPGEEFKIVVPVRSERDARTIFAERFAANVLVGERFDYDANYQTFWLLTPDYPVVRPMAWNQNNIFLHKAMLARS